jgi:hypothetical protein
MERVDEVTVSYTIEGETHTMGVEATSATGVDLSEVLETLLADVTGEPVWDLPPIRVRSAGVRRGPDGVRATARIALPEAFVVDLRRLPLVGADGGEAARIGVDALDVEFTRDGESWVPAFRARLQFAGQTQELVVPAPEDPAATPDVLRRRRSFGPLTVDSIDLAFDLTGLRVRLTARVGRGRVALEVIGLQALIPFANPADVRFSVDGLAVNYNLDPVTISGGLLIASDVEPRRYDGSLAVRFGNYGLSAIGSYAEADEPSLFAFLQVLVPIGGPPYFFVNRLAGGFGLNRELLIPPIEELEAFPLITGFEDWVPSRPGASVDSAIARIDRHLGPFSGANWLAAGLGVASFGIVQTQALLTLAFRGRVEIGVVGRATLEFPPAGPKVVRARMALRTVISPTVGEFSARGQLTPDSYVLDPDCRLTGGFAVCVWFAPHARAGDFVVTLGGYHPAFDQPPHYPSVPRLGVAWSPRGLPLTLKGTHYFALTPGLVMLGGRLEANWDKGPLRARFTIAADFLVDWEPFAYDATLGVTFALEARLGRWVTHTVAVNVGADLHVWGPPFSGRAELKVGVMSFTIEFGEPQVAPAPLDWPQFQERLLGPRETLLRIRVRDGLLGELARASYAVDAEQFEAATELAIPAKRVLLNGDPRPAGEDFDIAPMRLARADFESVHELEFERWTERGWTPTGGLEARASTDARVPKALWQLREDAASALGDEPTLEGLVTGVHLKPHPAHDPGWIVTHERPRRAREVTWTWGGPPSWASPPEPAAPVAGTIAQESVAAARAQIVGALLGEKVEIDVAALADPARLGLRAVPVPAAVGAR